MMSTSTMLARMLTALAATTLSVGCLFGFDDRAVTRPDTDSVDVTDAILDLDWPDLDATDIVDEDAIEDPDMDGDEPEAVSCDPGGADDHCDGNVLERCTATGDSFLEYPCVDRICVQDPAARCAQMGVHDVVDGSLLCAGTSGLVASDIPEGMTWVALLTDTGEIFAFNDDLTELHAIRPAGEGDHGGRVFTVQEQADGAPELGIMSLSEIELPQGHGFFTIGARAAVVLSCGPVVIAGAMSAAAIPRSVLPYMPGAGGGTGGTMDAPAGLGSGGGGAGGAIGTCTSGGGGGSHGGRGGSGGALPAIEGGEPGSVHGETQLVPLTAGSGGGAGGQPEGAKCAGEGGQGGGALLLASAVSIDVLVTGGIDAGGGAGLGGQGCGPSMGGGGGGGGGSGGAVLIEAPVVTILGYLLAAGGGGGAGAASDAIDGHDGTDGVLAWGPAQGGVGSLMGAGGGWGGLPLTGDAEAGLGADCSTMTSAGGGGGGDGIVRIDGLIIDISSALLHPTIDSGLLTTGSPLFL